MTDTKGSALPHPASLATTDLVLVVTTPGGTPASQSITFANLLKSGYSLSTFSDANYTAVATDTIVGQTGTLTAARVVAVVLVVAELPEPCVVAAVAVVAAR